MADFDLWIIEMFIINLDDIDEFNPHLGACVGMLSVSLILVHCPQAT
jgi:hypothetical protein